MLNTKDLNKIQLEEEDFYKRQNNFEVRKFAHWEQRTTHFRVTDDSLKNASIRCGKKLKWQEDFNPVEDEGCLFIVSFSGGDMAARFVEITDNNEFTVYAANERIPDLVCFADDIDIVGIVVPKMRNQQKFEPHFLESWLQICGG